MSPMLLPRHLSASSAFVSSFRARGGTSPGIARCGARPNACGFHFNCDPAECHRHQLRGCGEREPTLLLRRWLPSPSGCLTPKGWGRSGCAELQATPRDCRSSSTSPAAGSSPARYSRCARRAFLRLECRRSNLAPRNVTPTPRSWPFLERSSRTTPLIQSSRT
jgi:hypothetical protein